MSELKGTNGEWIVKKRTSKYQIDVNCGKTRICEVKSFTGKPFDDPTTKQATYNAKLIACAPEMLDMLIKINSHIDEGRGVNYMMELMGRKFYRQVEELINKATE